MLGRALSLATVTLLIGCFVAAPAWAQATNLEAGKSPSQIFAGTCTACHKSPRGLLKTVPPGSLQSFLRQHYTTSPEMASLLTSFLISNGATDTRFGQTKDGKDRKGEARPSGPSEQVDRFGRRLRSAPQEAGKPEAEPRDAAKPDADGPRGRHGKRLARQAEAAEATHGAGRGARRDKALGWSSSSASRDRARPRWPQIGCDAKAEQAGQAGRRRASQNRFCQNRFCQNRG